MEGEICVMKEGSAFLAEKMLGASYEYKFNILSFVESFVSVAAYELSWWAIQEVGGYRLILGVREGWPVPPGAFPLMSPPAKEESSLQNEHHTPKRRG